MQLTQVAYGGCWKRRHAWQRWSASTPRLAASQNGCVHSLGTGIGRVTLLQSLMLFASCRRMARLAGRARVLACGNPPVQEAAHGGQRNLDLYKPALAATHAPAEAAETRQG